ncbi:MAG: DNA-binding proteins Bright/BRCAA1/RBP1 and proteins containing BRIGHT domain [Alectoria sarmentosa]|nr:MAG: DNA-binding proteins Bright/BRCAA1/RBP1 and proteins containing BRIGHT domain [Alectoria sarmentosa]CAD6588085.1 MAG: DNA-binding proteins Bright/BRCAA1/RBP1 and proteins containing BRIGHT domain [Alectoria sarmentosa]
MAPTSTNTNSSIALALAGMTGSVDILKPRDNFWAGKDSFATVAARSLPVKKHNAGLPTPPNSISPSLPPQAYKGRASAGPLTPPAPTHVDSDIDLEDAVEHAKAQDTPQRGLTARGLNKLDDLDAVGTITPGLLAKHHLPGILLENGPLAIRHVMGYLTTSVPGFSGIPPAKARRLVVGALEGRGNDGQQGGIDGDVMFEKVGWGRWDARRRGQPSREARQHQAPYPQGSLRIPITSTRQDRTRVQAFATSYDAEREYDTPMEDISVLEHEADKMSLDSLDDSCSSSSPPNTRHSPDYDPGDVTDEEDWASIGAAALRQGSYPLSGGLIPTNHHRYAQRFNPKSRGRGAAGRPPSTTAKTMPTTNRIMYNNHQQQQQAAHALMGFSPMLEGSDAQDREAVEALLKLSSV